LVHLTAHPLTWVVPAATVTSPWNPLPHEPTSRKLAVHGP
jgi:hypothetical protein